MRWTPYFDASIIRHIIYCALPPDFRTRGANTHSLRFNNSGAVVFGRKQATRQQHDTSARVCDPFTSNALHAAASPSFHSCPLQVSLPPVTFVFTRISLNLLALVQVVVVPTHLTLASPFPLISPGKPLIHRYVDLLLPRFCITNHSSNKLEAKKCAFWTPGRARSLSEIQR